MNLLRISACTSGLLAATAALAGDTSYDYGSWNEYGGGEVRTLSRFGGDGELTGYGFQMTRGAVTSPDEHGVHMEFDQAGIPFDNVDIHFLPEGHPGGPGDTYWTVPHFDFHFFTVSEAERAGLTDPTVAYEMPSPAAIPTGYLQAPDSFVPTEGVHWFDPGEFAGGPPFEFTNSTIYGFYGGDMTFFEPMSSQAFMDDLANGVVGPISVDVAMPEVFPVAGLWPGEWTMDYDNDSGNYTIMLQQLQMGAVPGGGGLMMAAIGALGVSRRRRR